MAEGFLGSGWRPPIRLKDRDAGGTPMPAPPLLMGAAILYCERCGKLIPTEEAEAEDYAALGGPPVCPTCLAACDPERKARFESVRTTRLNLCLRDLKRLREVRPPEQVFPLPGAEAAASPTSTSIRQLREELV